MVMAFNLFDMFNYIGYFFGYILWFFFEITKNYGISIILFTILIKLILVPFSIKQQKTMAKSSKISVKQKELQKKYANNKQKLNEETAKLYSEEGINPMGGCLTSIFPLVLMLGVYYSVLNPLQNTLHIATSKISDAISMLQSIPGIGVTFGSRYGEIEIIKLFPFVKNDLTMFSGEEMENIGNFYQGFDFLGLDLLSTPQTSSWKTGMWLVPLLCFLSSVATTYLMQKMQGSQMQGQGCMKYMMYAMPLFSAWIAYTVPAAVGFYWIISTVLGFGQSVLLNKYYNINVLNAKNEAARIALRRQQEENMTPIK